MKKVLVAAVVMVGLFFYGMTISAYAQQVSEEKKAEVKAFVEHAVAYMKANGKEKAYEAFNDPKGQFIKGELYIVAQGMNGVVLANGGLKQLIGQNHLEMKDANGKYFVKEMVELMKTKSSGWVEYRWTNPKTKKVQPKISYLQKFDDSLYILCGVYY
jgi:signal transduction histidine kinase